MSERVMTVLSQFTPDLEIYSIDEAFLGLDGFADLEAYAKALRLAVLQWTEIPISVGIAPTKTVLYTGAAPLRLSRHRSI